MKMLFLFLIMAAVLLPANSGLSADKVVVIPLNSSGNSDKLWGEGRPDTGVMTMKPLNGYCQLPSGIKYALSTHLSDWNSTASVCPAQTWVCRENDISGQTPCSPPSGAKDIEISCSGSILNSGDPVVMTGWLADAGTPTAQGRRMFTDSVNGTASDMDICISYFAWCCWN